MNGLIVEHWNMQKYQLLDKLPLTDNDGGTWAVFKLMDIYESYAVGKIPAYTSVGVDIFHTGLPSVKDARALAHHFHKTGEYDN